MNKTKKSKCQVKRQIDKYLSSFDCHEVAMNFDNNNPEREWDDIHASGLSIDNVCGLTGRILS